MMLDVAQNQGENYVALKDIAARQSISKKYLEQIALALTQAGMLQAARGHQGGYRLLRAPEDYTLLEILEITEGSSLRWPVWIRSRTSASAAISA